MQQEMDVQPDSSRVFPPDSISSSSTTNFSARDRRRSPRLMTQHRQHPYIISGKKPSTPELRSVSENSSFGTDVGVGGPLTAKQRRFSGTLEPSTLTTFNVAPSTQLITSALIPDLTSLITRCSPDPISGGTYGNIYKCTYQGPEGNEEVRADVIVLPHTNSTLARRSPSKQFDHNTLMSR
jgi:hypothetical protein